MAPDITAEELDKEVREELRSLPGDLADLVGRHLVAAERALGDDDPDQAHEHTKVARRFAARIGVVREAAGIVAYRAGHFSEALSDLRAARRMTGSDAYLPIMADCERGLGRSERALDLIRSPEAERLDRAGKIELAIVESGARRDLGQHDAAVITLQRLPELRDPQPRPWSARLAYAYADALAEAGHQEAATDWFARAMAFDEDGETEAAERYAELTGAVIEDVEEDFDAESALDTDDDFDGDILSSSSAIAPSTSVDRDGDIELDDAQDAADVDDELDEEVDADVDDEIDDEIDDEVDAEVGDELDDEVDDEIDSETESVIADETDDEIVDDLDDDSDDGLDEDSDDDLDDEVSDETVANLDDESAKIDEPAKADDKAAPKQVDEATAQPDSEAVEASTDTAKSPATKSPTTKTPTAKSPAAKTSATKPPAKTSATKSPAAKSSVAKSANAKTAGATDGTDATPETAASNDEPDNEDEAPTASTSGSDERSGDDAAITPAFIEPDFGDILDQPDTPEEGSKKRTD